MPRLGSAAPTGMRPTGRRQDTQQNVTQHNDAHYSDTQHNGLKCDTQHNVVCRVAFFGFQKFLFPKEHNKTKCKHLSECFSSSYLYNVSSNCIKQIANTYKLNTNKLSIN